MARETGRSPQQQTTSPQRRQPDQQQQQLNPPGRGPAHSDLKSRPTPPTD